MDRRVVLVLALALTGCGAAQREQAAEREPPLEPCPPSSWAGGGTDWEIGGGVSCPEVGRFVFDRFEPHPGPSVQTAGGFTCDVQQPGGEYMPLHVACAAEDGRRFGFVFH